MCILYFGPGQNFPICIPEENGTMHYAKLYATLIASRGETNPTPERYVRHAVFPSAFGGTRCRENFVFLTARESFAAAGMLLRMCPGEVSRGRVAMGIGNMLDRFPVNKKTAWLRRAVRRYAGERPRSETATLWNYDGRKATGTRIQLSLATGIDYDRVRDLLTGRREMARGWSASEERAKQGPAKRGPRPKDRRMDFFKEEFGSSFF